MDTSGRLQRRNRVALPLPPYRARLTAALDLACSGSKAANTIEEPNFKYQTKSQVLLPLPCELTGPLLPRDPTLGGKAITIFFCLENRTPAPFSAFVRLTKRLSIGARADVFNAAGRTQRPEVLDRHLVAFACERRCAGSSERPAAKWIAGRQTRGRHPNCKNNIRIRYRSIVNAPPPKGGGFKLRLKAGLVRLRRTQVTLKSSSGSGGVWFLM
jgi:hypothetical protein